MLFEKGFSFFFLFFEESFAEESYEKLWCRSNSMCLRSIMQNSIMEFLY